MKKVIAIDGPSGVGKSSVARELAKRLDWTYLDTGAMYRVVTLAWLRAGRPDRLEDPSWLRALQVDFKEEAVLLGGEDVRHHIRSQEVTAHASLVSAMGAVRELLTTIQRRIGTRRPCVLEGRDIGTVVFPDAFFKIFLSAKPEVRARRRWVQQGGARSGRNLEDILRDQKERDHQDSGRDLAPLTRAGDAFVLDTSPHSQEQVVEILYREARHRLEPQDG